MHGGGEFVRGIIRLFINVMFFHRPPHDHSDGGCRRKSEKRGWKRTLQQRERWCSRDFGRNYAPQMGRETRRSPCGKRASLSVYCALASSDITARRVNRLQMTELESGISTCGPKSKAAGDKWLAVQPLDEERLLRGHRSGDCRMTRPVDFNRVISEAKRT